MVSSVSTNIQPPQINKQDKTKKEHLYGPAAYSVKELLGPPLEEEPVRKKRKENGGFLEFLGKTALLLGTVCIAAGITRAHTNFCNFHVDKRPKGLTEQIKYYFAKLGDKVNKTIVSLFQKSEK